MYIASNYDQKCVIRTLTRYLLSGKTKLPFPFDKIIDSFTRTMISKKIIDPKTLGSNYYQLLERVDNSIFDQILVLIERCKKNETLHNTSTQ